MLDQTFVDGPVQFQTQPFIKGLVRTLFGVDYSWSGETIWQILCEKGIHKNIDRPWTERDHALFVAYAPLKNPRYAISVVIEHGGSGSSTAAPVARDILAKTIAERDVT